MTVLKTETYGKSELRGPSPDDRIMTQEDNDDDVLIFYEFVEDSIPKIFLTNL